MARATTPTRRPPSGAAIRTAAASSSSAGQPSFARRVTFSAAGGMCSQPHHASSNNNTLPAFRVALPAAAAAAVVRYSRGRSGQGKRACACSPTTHPGSFRCALHRGLAHQAAASPASSGLHHSTRRSAMANSLVRIAAVEGGDHVRRALAALIRPSSHHQCRRAAFRPLPSRLSAMSTAADSPSPSPPPSQ